MLVVYPIIRPRNKTLHLRNQLDVVRVTQSQLRSSEDRRRWFAKRTAPPNSKALAREAVDAKGRRLSETVTGSIVNLGRCDKTVAPWIFEI